MISDPAVEGVLHLGAMAVLLSTGYLGLDRISRRENFLEQRLEDVRKDIQEWVNQLDMGHDGITPDDPFFYNLPAFFLWYLAEFPLKHLTNGAYFAHLIHRQLYCPVRNYLVGSWHRYVIGVFAFASLTLFLTIIYGHVSESRWAAREELIEGGFWVFGATVVLVFVTAILAHRIDRIDAAVERFKRKIDGKIGNVLRKLKHTQLDKKLADLLKK